jgi:hypothetical protein
MFENGVIGRIFVLKRDQVMRGWRRLHNEELHDVYCSPNITKLMKDKGQMGGAGSTHGEGEKCIQSCGWKG